MTKPSEKKPRAKKGLGGLAGVKVPKKKPAPPKPPKPPKPSRPPEKREGYTTTDREAFEHAFAGVRPLDVPAEGARPTKKRKKAGAPRKASAAAALQAAEESARARLDQLVAGGVSFHVTRDEGRVEGRRERCPVRTLRMLAQGELAPEARLDLHGLDRAEAGRAIRSFVRDEHRRGRRTLCIIHGKGKHSEGGIGVLQSATVHALTQGGAAPLVEAFVSAPERMGGEGAILVRLSNK